MKAAVLHGIGDLRYEEAALPHLARGEALIKVKSAGICGSDISRVYKDGTYHFPLIPGHEFSGEVVEIFSSTPSIKTGQRVTVFPLIPCRNCHYCRIGEYPQCENYDYMGSRSNGGFAEYAKAPIENLVLLPKKVSFEEGAMCEPASVALHAIKRTGVEAGNSIAIFGAGPIGLILAQWARTLSAGKIVLVDIRDDKLAFAKKMGFRFLLNAAKEDVVKMAERITGGKGIDLSIEASGAAAVYNRLIEITRPLGKIILMGNPLADVTIERKLISQILRKQLSFFGTWNSSIFPPQENEWERTLKNVAEEKIDLKILVTHRYPLSQINQALEMMREGKEFYNKVIIVGG